MKSCHSGILSDVLQVQVLSSLSCTLVLFPKSTANLHSNIQHAIKKLYKVLPCNPFEFLFFIWLSFSARTHPPPLKVLFLRNCTPFHLLLHTHPPFASGGAKYSPVTMSAIKCNSHCKMSAFNILCLISQLLACVSLGHVSSCSLKKH